MNLLRCAVCKGDRLRTLFRRKAGRTVATCAHCGLTQVVPLPDEKEVAKLYEHDAAHFDPYKEQISVHRAYFRLKLQDITLRLASRVSRLTILDIGCAMGVLLEEAQKRGIDAYGIDMSADAVSYCKKKGLHVSVGSATTAKLPKGKRFDAVTAFEVIEHERDPLAMMQKIRSLVAPGGIVVLTTPDHASFWRRIMGKWWVSYAHPEHLFFFDKKSMTALLSRAGFSSVTIQKDTSRPFPLSFLFTRAADYFPFLGFVLRPAGSLLDRFKLTNPINPWADMLVLAMP